MTYGLIRKVRTIIVATIIVCCFALTVINPKCIILAFNKTEELDTFNNSAMNEILKTQMSDSGIDYSDYIKSFVNQKKPNSEVILRPENISALNNIKTISDSLNNKALQFSNNGYAEWIFYVEETGIYKLEASYYFDDIGLKQNTNPEIVLQLNGQIPFKQALNIELKRYWKDGAVTTDANGNEVIPNQIQLAKMLSANVYDSSGTSGDFYFYLKSGENSLKIQANDTGMRLEKLRFYNEETLNYSDYRKQNSANGGDCSVVIQAENSIEKNESSLIPSSDRSGPDTLPSDPVKLLLNIISADNFKMPGQKITWQFSLSSDGYYNIGARYRQNDIDGLFVNRRILIDGKVPFTEFEQARFDYASSWSFKEFDYPVYLEEGTHNITFEISEAETSGASEQLENCVYILNYLYRKILTITGSNPDSNRDYSLDSEIPLLLPACQECSKALEAVYRNVSELSNQAGGQFSVLKQVCSQLDSFVNDPEKIAYRLDSFKSNISAISSLMETIQQQPMDLDYITVRGTNAPEIKSESGFLSSILYGMKAYIGSFMNDYVSVGSNSNKTGAFIKAWFNGGREQAEIINRLIDSDYTGSAAVKLQLVTIPIAQSILAGQEPDVVLNVGRDQPVNLAARGVLTNLSELPGFDQVKSWFNSDSLVPYQYNDNTYGIPVTLDYYMMFYRKDILNELGITYPKTWDELYKAIAVVEKANYEIGFPYNALSSQSINDLGILPALLIQRGGSFYSSDHSNILLDSQTMLSSFKDWTEFYTKYSFSLQYDFYSRFRTGEMPIGIQNYSLYNQLKASAPEIKGLWSMTAIPGTVNADGSIDNSESPSGSAAIMLKGTDQQSASWDFLKWWCSPDTQADYGNNVEMLMGVASRYNPASTQAMEQLSWSKDELSVLEKQKNALVEVPEVVGGYYAYRGINNAFRNVLFESKNYREELLEQNVIINNELKRKRLEFENN